MSEILIVLGKLMASTALLYGFYWLVLRNKASYKTARLSLRQSHDERTDAEGAA